MFRLVLYFLILKILEVTCEGHSSLAFVIDDTRSMKYDIAQVRKEVDSIMDIMMDEKSSQIKEIVLVTFNDPKAKLRRRTNNREEIKAALRSIKVGNYDNHDCPEASLEGIKVALQNSLPNSYLYVFTDATATDLETYDTVEKMYQNLQAQVTLVLTGDCGSIHTPGYRVYNKIATNTGGQVYRVDKDEVNQVIDTIKEMIKGKKAKYLARTVPNSNVYTQIPFTIDDKTEYALISASGKNVMMKLRGPHLQTVKLMWTKHGKVVKLVNPVPGDYVVKVKGSEAPNIVIYGRTDFVFTPGFSEYVPKHFNYTAKQPVAGTDVYLSIVVEDPEHEVIIEYAQILDMDGNVIEKLQLNKKGDFFLTEKVFKSPDSWFNVAVVGKVEKTGRFIKRITSVPIHPLIEPPPLPDSAPEVSIEEGSIIHSNYNGNLELTCHVIGKPKPSITWSDSKGNDIKKFETFLQVVSNNYVSHLSLNNVKETETYRCEASNILGTKNASIIVQVAPPFIINVRPLGPVNIPYESSKTLTCDITSALPMDLAWYIYVNSSPVLIENSNKYEISDDKKHLTIKSMEANLTGIYSCKAWLRDDKSTNIKFDVDVTASGMARPVIDTIPKKITIRELNSKELVCRIVTAIPPATITWYYKSPSSKEYIEVNLPNTKTDDNTLTIKNAKLFNTGSYKCVAKNLAGDAEHIIEVTVKGKPVVVIDQPQIILNYATVDEVNCIVTANPKPTIQWKDEMGNVTVDSSYTEDTGVDFEYALKMSVGHEVGVHNYYCYAKNALGVDFGKLSVEVLSPIIVGKSPENPIELDYGKQATLFCNITSAYPLFIKWYKIDETTHSTEIINDPEKFALLAGRTELRIHNVGLDNTGLYVCEAVLLLDNNLKANYKLNVTIKEIGIPVIEQIPKSVQVKENEVANIPCKLLKGMPPPQMIWEFMKQGSTLYERTSGAGQYLRIPDINLDHAGRYRCIAVNNFGKAEKITDLIVYKSPTIRIIEGNKVTIKYGATLKLTCKVTANPKPKIIWNENNNQLLDSKHTSITVGFEYTKKLEIKNVKENTKYVCIAENSEGTATAEVEITVLPTFKNTPPLPEITNVEYGKQVVIPCNVDSDLSLTRTWYRLNNSTGEKEELIESDNLAISSDGKQLVIYSVDLDHEGKYFCKGVLDSDKNETKEVNTNIKITGLVIPEIDTSISTVKVLHNDTAIIHCIIVKASPKPTITWQHKISNTEDFVTINVTNDKLEWKHVSIADSGVYKCNATNVAGSAVHETELLVQMKPVIVLENNTLPYSAVTGDVVLRVPCKAIGIPPPVITWKKNNEAIVPDKKYSIEDGTLLINKPIEEDTDEYTCEANNDIGKDTKSFEALVTDYLLEFRPRHHIYLKVGESRKIECQLPFTDPNSVRWYLEELTYENKTGPYIEIINAAESEDGNYSCRVSDRNMAMTETYVVDVGYPPELINNLEHINWHGENDEMINCEARAKPDATAKWLFNGKPINNSNHLTLPITNVGVYTCEVSNVHGTTGKNVTVTASVCLINRRKDVKENTPIYLTQETGEIKFNWPELNSEGDIIIIDQNETLILSCPSNTKTDNSFLRFPRFKEIEVTCDHEDVFLMDNNLYYLSDFNCKEKIQPVILHTNETCLNKDTEWLLVGFNSTAFVDVYKVCYDKLNGMPLFTNNVLLKMNNMLPSVDLDWYKYKGFEKGNEGYTCKDNSSCCYEKRQFVNVVDVVYGAPQISTYIDHVNSVPVWRPCAFSTRTSWNQIELSLRNNLELQGFLEIWTGGSRFENNEQGELVPRYLWKVVLVVESEVEVIIYVNNKHPNKDDILCKNTCHENTLSLPCDDKYTYMCEFEDFLQSFNITKQDLRF